MQPSSRCPQVCISFFDENDALLRLLHQICNTFFRLIFSKPLCPPLIKTEVELYKSFL